MPAEFYVGLMSGTSLDGVDAVIVDLAGQFPNCIATHFIPFDPALRNDVLAIQEVGMNELHRGATLGNRLADLYAEAAHAVLTSAGIPAEQVQAIGCHGQTVRHVPVSRYTLQLGNPARLAEQTGITVIADFRSRDIAAGGQGAPLVPAFHDAVFRSDALHRIILNIGGIANITSLAPMHPTHGFDTGPGNMLLDAWATKHLGKPWDESGKWADTGKPIPKLLDQLRAHPYFTGPPPKSCGREEFGIAFLEHHIEADWRPADVQATLIALTASSVADAMRRWCAAPDELFVCGGGAHNKSLMKALQEALPACAVDITDALGLPGDWVEAIAFAWLAQRTLHRLPGNLPEVTGARGQRVLGAIYPA